VQILEPAAPTTLPLPPRLLAALAVDYASGTDLEWIGECIGEPEAGARTSARVHLSASHDVWLIRWGVGSRTEMHDHGGSAGAFYVVDGDLVELRPGPTGTGAPRRREVHTFDHRAMHASHLHEVVNESDRVAVSVHVYSPPLTSMQHYEPHHDPRTGRTELRRMRREMVDVDTLG
jgi:hypothetical protein